MKLFSLLVPVSLTAAAAVAAWRLYEAAKAMRGGGGGGGGGFAWDSVSETIPPGSARDVWARGIVKPALESLLGREPSLAELQYGQSVGKIESSYGAGWNKCPCTDPSDCDVAAAQASNNWGAVQAKAGQPGFSWCDTNPDGSKYKQRFRSYATPQEGAADKLRIMFRNMPAVAASLASDGATVYRASLAMRRSTYYGGWCPKAISQYGQAANRYGDPKGVPAALACEAEAVAQHAKRAKQVIDAIAAANRDPKALPLGTLEDAVSWFDARRAAQTPNA